MLTFKQKIVMGALTVAAAGTWMPTLLRPAEPPRHVDEDEDEEEEADAGSNLAGLGGPVSFRTESTPRRSEPVSESTSGTDAPPPAPEKVDSTTPDRQEGEASGPSATELLSELQALLPRRGERSLDRLARPWAQPEETELTITTLPTPQGTEAPAPVLQDRTVRDFLEANPLSAVLFRKSEPLALLGPHLIREGTELAGGRLRVHAIERHGVRLREGEAELFLSLPPVRFRPRAIEGEEEPAPVEEEQEPEIIPNPAEEEA